VIDIVSRCEEMEDKSAAAAHRTFSCATPRGVQSLICDDCSTDCEWLMQIHSLGQQPAKPAE